MAILIKRVYEHPSPDDGQRILIDRLWPRGIAKEAAGLAAWRRDLAPSDALRRWYGHDPSRFPTFRERYRAELSAHRSDLEGLAEGARDARLTLVYAAKDPRYCNATVLRELLEELARRPRAPGSVRRRSPPARRNARPRPAARARPKGRGPPR